MILYLDTSALVPLLVSEPASEFCVELWDRADRVATVRLAYVEASAALAMACRLDRITTRQLSAAGRKLDDLWRAFDVIELEERLMVDAAREARSHALRAYDAVHCAAATELNEDDLVAAAGDQVLLGAWRANNVSVVDVTQP